MADAVNYARNLAEVLDLDQASSLLDSMLKVAWPEIRFAARKILSSYDMGLKVDPMVVRQALAATRADRVGLMDFTEALLLRIGAPNASRLLTRLMADEIEEHEDAIKLASQWGPISRG